MGLVPISPNTIPRDFITFLIKLFMRKTTLVNGYEELPGKYTTNRELKNKIEMFYRGLASLPL